MCGHCIARAPSFDSTLTLADYVTPVSGMVGALKFSARLDLADLFGRSLADREPLPHEVDLVLAVPLSHERESGRGSNQSREIARRYARLTDIPLRDGACFGSATRRHSSRWPGRHASATSAARSLSPAMFGVSAWLWSTT